MSGGFRTHDDVREDLELTTDVCIVGSGAGGAVLAAGLAEAGLEVIVLEAGPHRTRDDFTLEEQDAYPGMYQERGTRSTADVGIAILQGRTVGGSTTINWTTCFRTPQRIREHWARVHGIEDLDLDPHFEAVESRLNIGTWPAAMANANNDTLRRGCEALGWEAKPLRRNVKGCANSGYCGVGCPVDGKQAMGITYLQDAVDAGAVVQADVVVARLDHEGGRVSAVRGQVQRPGSPVPDGPRVTVRPKVTVVAGGAINSPALLLRSGIDGGGTVGRRTFLHPVVGALAYYEDVVAPYHGAPQSMGSHEFIDRGPDEIGYFLEAAPLQPMLAAVAMPQMGTELRDWMSRLPHLSALIALSVDGLVAGDDGGTVTLRSDGRPRVDYPFRPVLQRSFRHASETLARIHLAAGAVGVGAGLRPPVLIRDEAEIGALDGRSWDVHEVNVFSAHQMGGCGMGSDPDTSVVDTEHRVRGFDDLFVVDGSVLPTALGVNPSQTIYGLAHRARRFVGEAV